MTIKVDLLDKPGRRAGFDPVLIFLAVLILLSFVGFYIIGAKLDKDIAEEKAEIVRIDDEIAKLEDKIPEIARLEDINKELENQINVIKELVYDPIRYANLLDEIAFLMPESIFVNSLQIEPKSRQMNFSGMSVEIKGAKPLDSISRFMQNIQKSKYFKNASLTNTTRGKVEGRDAFTFQIRVQYDPEAAALE